MGTIHNHAVIATTWSQEEFLKVREWADKLDPCWRRLFLFSNKNINDSMTVVMVPDGSKEGWKDSDFGDRLRSEFLTHLSKLNSEGFTSWDFLEVEYGELGQSILQGNCKLRGHRG